MGLEEYFQLEGIAFRLVPIKSHNKNWLDYGRVNTTILYDNMMNKFQWRGANDPDVYIDHFHNRTLTVIKARYNYARLAMALVEEGDNDKALKALDHCLDQLPFSNLPHDLFSSDIAGAYFAAGNKEKGRAIALEGAEVFFGRAEYWNSQSPAIVYSADYDIQTSLQYASRMSNILEANGFIEESNEMNRRIERIYSEFVVRKQLESD